MTDPAVESAAASALELIRDGMRVGLGTGHGAVAFLARLADRVRNGLRVVGVPTSEATAAEARSLGGYQQRAFDLVSSPGTRKAFDLAGEPAAVRDRYGRTQFGQCCLLARRLAEAGVPVVNVHYCRTPTGSWM